MARCRALLRRREQSADAIVRFGGLEMNRVERTVFYNGVSVELTTKEFALLEFLILRRGVCCPRSELLNQVWHSSAEASTNIVDVYITYLRKKLSAAHPEDNVKGSIIETVRGSGYRVRDRRKVPRLESAEKRNAEGRDERRSMTELAYGA